MREQFSHPFGTSLNPLSSATLKMRTRLPRLRPKQFITSRQSSTTTSQDASALKQSLLKRTFPVQFDQLSHHPQVLLHASLSDFLPPAPSYYNPKRFLDPGSHLLLFRPVIPERDLLPDGTDIQHAPDLSYKYRLWAGGEFSLHQGRPIALHQNLSVALDQRIMDVNARTNNDASQTPKVWINIHRDIHWAQEPSDRGSGHQHGERPEDKLLISEKRWLVFSQQRPDLALDKVTAPPEDSFYSVSMKPTSSLLFRFSALTFNAHAVHFDPEYTRNEYGLPGLLVHGPLTLVLMMEVLARGFDQYAQENDLDPRRFLIRKVQYRNIGPIFVGEDITICCKPQEGPEAEAAGLTNVVDALKAAVQQPSSRSATAQAFTSGSATHQPSPSSPPPPAPKHWDVWIQKSVHGQPSVCVKGTVTFGNVGDVEPGDSDRWKAASKKFVFGATPVRRIRTTPRSKRSRAVAEDVRTT